MHEIACPGSSARTAEHSPVQWLTRRMEKAKSGSVACASLTERKRVVRADAVGLWRRRATDPAERVPLRSRAVVLCGAVIGSLVLVRVFAASASWLVVALFILFVVLVFWCQWWASDRDAADPLPLRRCWSNAIARPVRLGGAWVCSAVQVMPGLSSRFARVVAVLRREHTRDTVRQWLHATTDALSGIPPLGVSPPAREDSASGEGPSPSSRHAA